MRSAETAMPPNRKSINKTHAITWFGLLLVLSIAAVFRFYDINWDSNNHLHPDERHIVMVTMDRISLPFPNLEDAHLTDPKLSTLNPRSIDPANGQPRSFAYGAFPLYLLKAVNHAVSPLGKLAPGIDGLTILGRLLSAIFDLGTVLLAFLIGRRLYGARAGLLAALLLSVSVLHIQLSHFYASDTLLTFFLMATLYFGLKVADHPSKMRVVAMGVAAGLALSCKVSAAPVLLACAVACFVANKKDSHAPSSETIDPDNGEEAGARLRPVAGTTLSGVVAAWVFLLFQPYVPFDPQSFIKDIQYESEMVRGIQIPPYTIQYIGTEPVIYQLRNMFSWTAGPTLTVAILIGLAVLAARLVWHRRPGEWVIAAWLIPYLFITLSFQVKFVRYLLPVMPLLVILASAWISALASGPFRLGNWRWRIGIVTLVLVIGGTVFQALAFTSIYDSEHTRVRASRWIYDNIPRGASLAVEHWDDSLPLAVAGAPGRPGDYVFVTMPMYDYENDGKRQEVLNRLAQVDYIILSSNRLYGSIPRAPESYPMSTAYYSMLFDGRLGFDLVATFTSYPALGPFKFNDDKADESFTVYDHPKVLIFKKSAAYSQERVAQLLGAIPLNQVAPLRQTRTTGSGLLMGEVVRSAQEDGGTWSVIYDPENMVNRLPILSWWFTLQLLGILALPFTWRLFARYSDRGYGLAKPLGLLVTAYVAWLLPSLKLVPFGRWSILVGLIALASLSVLAIRGKVAQFRDYLSNQRRVFLIYELLFLGAFALMLLIRARNPDLWHLAFGGEKPMEFAFLNAVAKSTYFPPYDPWFAGGYINYYYFGYVIVATLIRLTGIVPAVAFNLAIASIFALTATGLFSFGFNYFAANREAAGQIDWRKASVGGISAVTLVLLIGNLDGIVQTLEALWKLGGLQVKSTLPMVEGTLKSLAGLWAITLGGRSMPQFDFWRSTRIIGPENPTPISEFPYFTFLYGDLHPHMIAMPLATLAIGLALSIVWQGVKGRVDAETRGRGDGPHPLPLPHGERGDSNPPLPEGEGRGEGSLERQPNGCPPPRDASERSVTPLPLRWERELGDSRGEREHASNSELRTQNSEPSSGLRTQDSGRRTQGSSSPSERLLTIAVGGLVVGALQATNSWDYPTYMALLAVAFIIASYLHHKAFTVWGMLGALISAAATYAVAMVLFLPFTRAYELFYNGVDPSPGKTSLPHYLVIFGFFLFTIGSTFVVDLANSRTHRFWLSYLWERLSRSSKAARREQLISRLVHPTPIMEALPYVLLGLVAAALVAIVAKLYLIALLLLFGAFLLLTLFVRDVSPEKLLVILFAGTGLALTLGVEFVTIKGDIGRMNTVFKFYLQAWFLFGIASAVGITETWSRWRNDSVAASSGWRTSWATAMVVLLFSVMIYPVAATPVKLGMRFQQTPLTLDGMAYMDGPVFKDQNSEIHLSGDYRAIRWIQGNIAGSPTVLEAQVPEYRWGSRVSIYTGLPTILGWTWHERQQRWGYQGLIEQRLRDIKTMFESTDSKQVSTLLKRYQVRLIYVGDLERAYYPASGLAKFDQMVGDYLSVIYRDGGVTIYEVKYSERPSVVLSSAENRS